MLFDNVPFFDTLIVMAVTYVVGVAFFFFFSLYLRSKNAYLSQFKNYKQIFKGSLIGGVAFSFLLSIAIVTLTPTVITIENGHKYTKGLSFSGNEGFLGFRGCYVVNNSSQTLRVVGIDRDIDIDVVISPNSTEQIRKCPDKFFDGIPSKATSTISYTYSRGRRKPIQGPTVFLDDYQMSK